MTNKRSATFKAVTLAVFLLFVSSGDAGLSGFVVPDSWGFDRLPGIEYLEDPTSADLKKKIVSALKTLSIDGKQSCLVQYWAATKAGNAHLLATTDQPFGIYGTDTGLKLYRKACLHHKLYVHREKKRSFGLPGHTFKDRTPHQTQNMHDYPEDQRPPCEVIPIFSKIWGSFAVPVIVSNECIGVLEFVDTEPAHSYDGDINAHSYDGDINAINEALKYVGFESFNIRNTQKDTFIPKKRQRKTNSTMYAHYNVLVPHFGLCKEDALEKVGNKFPKKQTKTTRKATHIPDSAEKAKKDEKKSKVNATTFDNALREVVGIPEWPCIRKTPTKASCGPKTQINMASAASSFGSLNADDLTSCLVQWEASERSLEQTTITNTSALETQNDQIVSCNTSYTEALPESEHARPNVLPEGNRFECPDHEVPYLHAFVHFVVDNDHNFPGLEIPYWSESRTDQTLCDETVNNAGYLNSECDYLDDFLNDLVLDQETHNLSETHTDQTLCDGTSSIGILNDDFNSSRDKGVYEKPVELITTTSASASEVHQSSSAGLEQSCETGDDLFFQDFLTEE